MKKEKLERIVEADPAFDKRSKDPKKNYGIHGVSLRFVLKGKKGAVQFVVYTGMQLPHVQEEFAEEGRHKGSFGFYCPNRPMAADVGYHSYKPIYEGQEAMGSYTYKIDEKAGKKAKSLNGKDAATQLEAWSKAMKKHKRRKVPNCPYLGKPCYYDGSGLHAETVFNEVFLPGGTEKLWPYLEDYYYKTFYEQLPSKSKKSPNRRSRRS